MKFVSHRRSGTAAHAKDAKREDLHVLRRGKSGAVILGLAAAAAVAVPASASASTGAHRADASPVAGHVYVNDNTAGHEHHRGVRPARRRHADPGARLPVRRRRRRDRRGPGLRRARSRSRRTAGSCSPSTRAATRSRCCGSTGRLAAARAAASVPSGGILPVSIAVHGNLVYVANAGNGDATTPASGSLHGQPDPDPRARPSRCPLARQPGDVLFNSTGTKLVGTEWAPRRSTASPSASTAG